jgi:hypothetical protein
MKPKFLTLSLPIALIASFALLGQNQAYAAAETSYSKLTAITVKARVAAFDSGIGEVCLTSDYIGDHRDTTSYSPAPIDYSGSDGDLWVYAESEFPYIKHYFYWDGVEWLTGAPDEEGSEEGKLHSWNLRAGDHGVMVREARESSSGYVCTFSNLKRIERIGQEPISNYVGEIGDIYVKIDSKYQDARMYFAWNGVKWIASLKNPYTLASAVASRTKAGNYCVYGANKDFSTSYYSVPPKSYKGVKGDLWVITDKTYGDFKSMYFWTGKVWVVSTSKEAEPLQKLNDELQLKARASSKGEVCYSGSITSTQVFSTKVPTTYKGKVNDRWVVMDKAGVKANIYYYWDGKKWKQD